MGFCLSLTVPPVILSVYPEQNQTNYTVNETVTVTFECSATGIPAPTITWFRNGIELRNNRTTFNDPISTDHMRTRDGETVWRVTRTLDLANTADTDSGMYMCRATNDAEFAEGMFELIVQSKPHIK